MLLKAVQAAVNSCIDDYIIHAEQKTEVLNGLDKLSKAFSKHNLTLSARTKKGSF